MTIIYFGSLLYTFTIGVYFLAILISGYYYSLTGQKSSRLHLGFSLSTFCYALASLFYCIFVMPKSLDLVLIHFVPFLASASCFLYFAILQEMLGIADHLVKNLSKLILSLGTFCLLCGVLSLFFDVHLLIKMEALAQSEFFFARVFDHFTPSSLGGLVLILNSVCTFGLFLATLVRHFSLLQKERLLLWGLVISSGLIIHDSFTGMIGYAYALPLISLGYIPEMVRFMSFLIESNYSSKKLVSKELSMFIRRTEKSRLFAQFLHDSRRLTRKILNNGSVQDQSLLELEQFYLRLMDAELEETISLKAFIFLVIQLFQIELDQKNVAVRLLVPEDQFLTFDRSDLFVVFTNLMQNSLDHSQATEITIKSEQHEACLEIVYSDDGGGIPSTIAQKLFKKGFTTSSVNSGAGLSYARDAALSNSSTLEFSGDEANTQFSFWIYKGINSGD